jgi:hypothetical protein
MGSINDLYPSTYLKAADLKGKTVKAVIDRLEVEEVGDGNKPVLYFEGKDRGIVLNKTNALTLQEAYGDETDDWTGKGVELFSEKVAFEGRRVDGLRVRAVELPKPKVKAKAAVLEVDAEDEEPDIKF